MIFTYHRVGRISLLPALAIVASAVVMVGVATITLAIVGVAAYGIQLLHAIGRIGPAERRVPFQDHTTIEGVVVDSMTSPISRGVWTGTKADGRGPIPVPQGRRSQRG